MQQTALDLHQLLLYRNIIEDPVIHGLLQILDLLQGKPVPSRKKIEDCYFRMLHKLLQQAEEKEIQGNVWKKYILRRILDDENIFSLGCERMGLSISPKLLTLAIHDLEILLALYYFDWQFLHEELGLGDILADIYIPSQEGKFSEDHYHKILRKLEEILDNSISLQEKTKSLAVFYHRHGCGKMAKFLAFRWGDGLIGIAEPDSVSFDDLVGYSAQKEVLITNTRAFVHGIEANNILLYGEKGCGKSSSVKALLNLFADEGLRMVELTKTQLVDFNRVVQTIRNRGHRFIVFIDDLSFEDFEVEYKYIKASLEGNLEASADNVLIYVTSNRRHLIKENWGDRQRTGEEVHVSDSHQEKLSFGDRFGITISYYSPDQEQYLGIVEELARKRKIEMPKNELLRQAIQWEISHHGRSGRTAQQFITFLLCQ